MLPKNIDIMELEESQTSNTYRLDFNQKRIIGKVNDLEAVEQALRLILSTERYESVIYNWDYGAEFDELIGKQENYVLSEFKRMVTESLLVDDRVEEVTDFIVNVENNTLHATFTVLTNVGMLKLSKEVVY